MHPRFLTYDRRLPVLCYCLSSKFSLMLCFFIFIRRVFLSLLTLCVCRGSFFMMKKLEFWETYPNNQNRLSSILATRPKKYFLFNPYPPSFLFLLDFCNWIQKTLSNLARSLPPPPCQMHALRDRPPPRQAETDRQNRHKEKTSRNFVSLLRGIDLKI